MLYQQFWCWGRDVRAAPNLLLAFGAVRHAAPTAVGLPGVTRYVVTQDDGARIVLWGFGVAVRPAVGAGVFVHRYRRGARVLPNAWDEASLVAPEALPPLRRPAVSAERLRSAELVDRLLDWIERYERWVRIAAGDGHRAATLARWEHPIVAGPAMADAWRGIRDVHRRATTACVPLPRAAVRAGRR